MAHNVFRRSDVPVPRRAVPPGKQTVQAPGIVGSWCAGNFTERPLCHASVIGQRRRWICQPPVPTARRSGGLRI